MEAIFNIKTLRGVAPVTKIRKAVEGEFTHDLTPQQLALFAVTPRRYGIFDGVFTDFPNWQDEIAAEKAAKSAILARLAALEQAAQNYGLHKYTIEQANKYIDDQFLTATTAVQIKAAVQEILKKMAVYILR